MPRPKRTKIVPVKKAPTPAPTTATNPNSPSTHNIRQPVANPEALVSQEATHLRDSGSDVSLVSQGLKIASRRAVARKSLSGRELPPRETRMSGALRIGEDVAPSVVVVENTETERAKGHATPATNTHTRNGRTRQRKVIKKVTDDDKVLEDLKKRRNAALQAEKASVTMVPNTQTSGVETDQEGKPGEEQESTLTLNDTSEDISHGAVIVPNTPAVEASVVAIANFKRRPRQPSILRMVQQQKEQQHEQQNQGDNQIDSMDAAEDGSILGLSDPEDESTPLPNRTAARKSSEHAKQSSSSRKRKASDAIDISHARALQSSPPVRQTSPLTLMHRFSVLHSDSPSLPDQSTIIHQARNQNSNIAPETSIIESQAPPQSSSGEESASETPAQDTRERKQRRTQAQSNDKKKPPPSKKPVLTTAQLRNMLPRSQRRSAVDRSSPFEIHSSSSATLNLQNNNSDYDELTLAKSQRFHKQQKHNRGKDTSSTKQLRRTYSQQQQQQQQQQQHHLSSDKENESASDEDQSSNDDNDSDTDVDSGNDKTDGNFGGSHSRRNASKSKRISARGSKKPNSKKKALQEINQQRPRKPSAELQSIANKFKEIDAWKMSFESVDFDAGGETGAGSSPWR